MERISFGGRATVGFGDRWVAGYPLDAPQSSRIQTSCGEALPPVQSGGAEIGCGSPGGKQGVLVPPFVVAAGAGAGVAGLAYLLGAPIWGTVVSGVGLAVGTWAALRDS